MEMLNEAAIRIIEAIPVETPKQKAAIKMATEALTVFKSIQAVPDQNRVFHLMDPEYCLHIYCKDQEEMDILIERIKKGWGE